MVDKSVLNTAQEYINSLPNELKPEKAYLFGSFADGKESKDSDIDIALVLNKIDDFFDIQLNLMRLRRKIDLRIEPHPIQTDQFNHSNPLANEILIKGIKLKIN